MRHVFVLGFALAACATGRTSAETLPKLKAAMESPVSSAEQNLRNSELVSAVSREKHIHGLTRDELQSKLGRGQPCSKHPLCAEKGFYDDDWFYEVGEPGDTYVRYRPMLLVGFSRFGKVERTFVREVR